MAKMTRAELVRELKAAGSKERAVGMARYFKTGAGEYGEGDVFLGITTPVMRKIAMRYCTLELDELRRLLESRLHEHRSAAVEILVKQYAVGDEVERTDIVAF